MPKKQKDNLDLFLDKLFDEVEDPKTILGKDGLLGKLTKRMVERLLQEEMEEHLGYKKHDKKGNNSGNSRNGYSKKSLLTQSGSVDISIPRDRESSFAPQIIAKGQRRLPGFEDKILSMYARGMTTREIQGHLEDIYSGAKVSPALISRITDGVKQEVIQWQNRPLTPIWPIVYLDALVVKVRDEGVTQNKSVYLALGVNLQGKKEVLGLWMAKTEGAKFWLHVITQLKNRGVEDILIACVDGLKGFPEAISSVFPNTIVQTCIVHMIRQSTRFVSWKNRRAVANSLKPIYQANSEVQGKASLEEFGKQWGKQYPMIYDSWKRNWEKVCPFFSFSPNIRKAIYTTNAIESINRQLRKTLKTRGSFPSDMAVFKLLYLALENASKKWTMPIKQWDLAIQQLAIHFHGRITMEHFKHL